MVNKITTPPTTSELIGTVNEIIDDKQDTISDLATIRSGSTGNVKLAGGSSTQTVSLTSGTSTTALGVKSKSGSSYISFSGSSGWLASFGIGSDKKPTIYDGSSHTIAYTSDIPTVNNATLTITQGGVSKGTFTANASSDVTIALDSGGSSLTAGTGIDITNDIISVTNAISTGAALGATALQPSALNGYATQAWVGQQGYITSITSSDVTTALGYTPYNSSNPNGYITNLALTPYALSADLASVATSGSYNDLSNKPTIPTVNNATLTIQKNGTNVATFTANASSNVTANISVPNTVSSVSSSSTNADAVGAKLFYDTVGDIETLINAL